MIKGSHHKPESNRKNAEAHKGKIIPPETRKKMSEAKMGEKNNFFGKHHKLETRKRISISHSGENCLPETRRKLSEAQKGRKATLKTRKRLSEVTKGKNNPFYGKKHKPESKKKISDYRKGRKLSEQHKKSISESLKGEKCHLWRGGISFQPYGLAFNKELREQIRDRDGHRCQECFKHESELFSKNGKPEKLSIHHTNYDKQDNRPDNLISLCKSCHCKTNFDREKWTKYFQTKLALGGVKNGTKRLVL